MELKLNQVGKIKIIEISGKYDIESTEEFEKIFNQQLDSKPQIVAIDMTKLDYIDSSGIGSLIKCLNSLKNKNGKMILVGIKPMIMNVFKLAKLDMFFEIISKVDFDTKYMDNDDDIDALLKK
ncbi:MAG: STAS domain-containing protein [Leptospiraceae bacterium]|jgi:anti-sigma B factor antagonist|nr:STAS domain-containing protein [Leptospiraceae bacterium]MCZ8346860.1 STAS domain-containing protein [Leptospiraceae bacterium]